MQILIFEEPVGKRHMYVQSVCFYDMEVESWIQPSLQHAFTLYLVLTLHVFFTLQGFILLDNSPPTKILSFQWTYYDANNTSIVTKSPFGGLIWLTHWGGTVMPWLALLPHSKKVPGEVPGPDRVLCGVCIFFMKVSVRQFPLQCTIEVPLRPGWMRVCLCKCRTTDDVQP